MASQSDIIGSDGGPLGGDIVGSGFAVGDLVSDVGDKLSHPADTVSDLAKGGLNIIVHPEDDFNAIIAHGPDALGSAFSQSWMLAGNTANWIGKGLSDFAKSSVGRELLNIAAGAEFMVLMFSPLAPLAYLVFAVPGLMRGDDFSTAWLHGMFDQGIRIAKAVSSGKIDVPLPPEVAAQAQKLQDAFSSQTGTAASFLEQNAPQLQALGLPDLSHLDFVTLASKLGIREDAAEAALVNMRNNMDEITKWKGLIASGFFDPLTGKANISAAQRGSRFTQTTAPASSAVKNVNTIRQLAANRFTTQIQAPSAALQAMAAFTAPAVPRPPPASQKPLPTPVVVRPVVAPAGTVATPASSGYVHAGLTHMVQLHVRKLNAGKGQG
jgi:hypothetical protein